MAVDQLGLLLWKNYIVRKRQPGMLALVFLWPIAVFMILYTIRDNVDPEYNPTCQFPARTMPQDGILPFIQSFVCSVGNPCDPLAEYEDVPSYKNATLEPLMMGIQSMLGNDTILSAVKTLPKSIQLLKSMAEILTKPEIKALFDKGIRLGDLFNNHDEIKSLLKAQIPNEENVVDGLFDSSIKLVYLIEMFGSSNIDDVICSPDSLKKYLILPHGEHYSKVSRALCEIDSAKIPEVLENLSKHLDFSGLLAMIDRAMAKFRDYDFYQDLMKAVETILELNVVKENVPKYLRVREWLPEIILLFKNVTFKTIDLKFIDKAVAILDPVFSGDFEYMFARHGLLRINSILGSIKNFLDKNNATNTEDFFAIFEHIWDRLHSNPWVKNDRNVTEILDMTYDLLQDGLKLTNKLMDRHKDSIQLSTEVMDGLKYFFTTNIVNTLTYASSMISNVVEATHHFAVLYEDAQRRIYEVAKTHQNVIENLLTHFDPSVYRTLVRSFSRLEFQERLIEKMKDDKVEEVICQEDIFNEIFDNFRNLPENSHKIRDTLCDASGKEFVAGIYNSFNFDDFSRIVQNSLSSVVSIAIQQPVGIDKSNLTTAVQSVRRFVAYLKEPPAVEPDWTVFKASKEWLATFEENQAQGRLDIMGIHLSIAKMLGIRSLSYIYIKADLQSMDILADLTLEELRANPTTWVGQVITHEAELIEAFYLTVTDRVKTLKFLEYANFTKTYCTNFNPPPLINYPKGSNETLLKDLVCHLAKAVQTDLELNVTEVELKEERRALSVRAAFNWTAFNEKVVEIYRYIDVLVHQNETNYDSAKFRRLKSDFVQSWTRDITIKDAWEISVGLLCKLFNVMESPVFSGMHWSETWKFFQATGWATSVIFDSVETIVDQIQENGDTAKLSEILRELPQTKILLGAFLRNLPSIILDIVDVTTMKLPVHLISTLNEYKKREKNWPCIMEESVGKVLEFRNGTCEAVREIERIACNPESLIREWKEQSVIVKVRKIFQHNDDVDLPVFNWTSGYVRFRRLVGKIELLLRNATNIALQENPKLATHMKIILPEIENIVDNRVSQLMDEPNGMLDYMDLELEKMIDVFKGDLSVRTIWSHDVSTKDRLLVLLKFISYTVHKASNVILDIFNENATKINWLSLLGFTRNTPIGIYYHQLPYVLATVINGLSDPQTQKDLLETWRYNGTVTCTEMFKWWEDFRVGLSLEEYYTLKNFTCHLDPGNFNAYTVFYLNEVMIWRTPVKNYPSHCAAMVGDLYNVGKVVRKAINDEIPITCPFSRDYLQYVLKELKDSLETKHEQVHVHEQLQWNSGWTRYVLAVEGLSEVFLHISDSIKELNLKERYINSWDLFKNGDVRQLLKILESYPEETIALAATIVKLYPATKVYPSYENFRKMICTDHFKSDYWSTPNRTRFLTEICYFDADQLLKTATSGFYYDLVGEEKLNMSRSVPLSLSVTKLLDAIIELLSAQPDIVVKSNLLKAQTWQNLSKNTMPLVREAQESMINQVVEAILVRDQGAHYGYHRPEVALAFMSDVARTIEVFDSLAELFAGGDVWQKLKRVYENSRIKHLLNLVEDAPNLAITFADTFVSSERLGDYEEKLIDGRISPCDIDRYLLLPNFIRKRSLLVSISKFCEILDFRNGFTVFDFLPVDMKREEKYMVYNESVHGDIVRVFNKTYLIDQIFHFHTTLVRVMSEGYKPPKTPAWWTSFKEGTYKDFISYYNKQDLRTLAHTVVKKTINVFKAIMFSPGDSGRCSWCNTFSIDILNSQLSRHRLYKNLLCDLRNLNFSQLHDVLIKEFYWNKTSTMIKDYKYLNHEQTFDVFMNKLEDTLQYVADIMIDFQNKTYSEEVSRCFHQFVGEPLYSRPGLYVTVVVGFLDTLEHNLNVIDTAATHARLGSLTRLAEQTVPIWKPLREVVKNSDVDVVDNLLPSATINVNAILNARNRTLCRSKPECRNSTTLYAVLNSKRAGKFLRYDPKAAKYPSVTEIAERLATSLDLDRIDREKRLWRQQASWDLVWLKELLQHMSLVLGKTGNLLDIASKIDFEDISNVLGVPDVADGIVNILKDNTVDKLFDGMKEILEDVEPFFKNSSVVNDLYSIVSTLESMEIFKNLGLLDMRYLVKDMFDDWDTVRSYLVDNFTMSHHVVQILSQSRIDMLSVFMKERRAISLRDSLCSPEKLVNMLNFHQGRLTAEEVSTALCKLDGSKTQNVTITLLKNLNFDYILKTLMSANVKNILANANLTEVEGKVILANLGVAAELLPFFKEHLSKQITPSKITAEESDKEISSSKFLQDSSEMLCGKPLITDNGQLYKIISTIKENSQEYDQKELDSLPTEFCKITYKDMVRMPGGKIIWSYVKPLIRGQILYTPNATIIDMVMTLANESFIQMEHFGTIMNSFEKTLVSLVNLVEMEDNLRELQDVMSSDVMKIAIKSMSGGNFQGDLSELDLSEMTRRLKRSKGMIKMVSMLNDLIECVLVNRVRGFASEEDLEAEARRLMDTNEFLAGVVFTEDESNSKRQKRSLQYELPDNVTYKIRMDVDYVPSTKRLKSQFWIPGPESSFVEDLRYLRGFVQLQDAIDRAIIMLKLGKDQAWRTVTQQMPYPCWKFVPFQQTLYESQGIQMCFFFALMMCVGSAVRHIVWERESRNAMVMSVMGLKPWRNTFAWFLTSYIELTIVMISISLILLAGKVLPKSDPFVVLLLLFDYIFAVVTFCYMISTMFSSASLSAVTTVVMFLLTYMPYIIVIAMEATIGLAYKLLICLSMSTSFCYGCLYAARREVQGIGLTWRDMWEESSPGDSMSLGLVFFMIALDGCLYALIGYLVTRYTNSGRGFHGLRSRSLWWAGQRSIYGRPSYLTFVNNLYFTNDVTLPSSTTHEEEDVDNSNLMVSEKQIGVKFENVRKVFSTDQGDVVAVDDFSLKLFEGEVTSLLGRNGAGKTTIIKMLTGMLAPTSGEICLSGEENMKPDIGVCPQDNVLIGTLTPREHMVFYSKLKRSANNNDMQRNVDEMLTSLELGRREHEPVSRLSGGTKRRLCVALAFLGSPKLVILDEPGAGVDPAARRRIWRLIDQHRMGRTVLLSTHHLDEADMLSDTVVVMHRGKILCTGSPLSLKMTYGRGYRIHVAFPSPKDVTVDSVDRDVLETLRNVVEKAVPNALITDISGTEVVVTVPFQGKHGVNNDIAQVSKVFEDNAQLVGYTHFSLECDSLERVFLDLCSRADSGSTITRSSADSVVTMDQLGLSIPNDDVDLIEEEVLPNPSPFRQAKALLKKRLWHFTKDWRSPLAALILPTIFVAVAMGFSLIRPPSEDEPPLVLNPKLYDTHPTYFYSINDTTDLFLQHVSLQLHDRFGDDYAGAWQTLPNDTGTCDCREGQQTCQGGSQMVEGLLQTLPGRPTLDWIVSTHQQYIEKRYGGWSLARADDGPLFIVWYNNKGHHSMPAYLNALNQAILRAYGVPGHITAVNHPLKLSRDQLNRTSLLQHVADVGIALVLLIAFSLVGAQGTKEVVRERLSEEKRILYLAGVHPITYWTTTFVWDLFVFACSIFLAVIVFEIFGLSTYVAKDNLPGTCLLLALFAWAAIPFSHLAEKCFDDSSLSNMVLFCVNTFIGVASLATILVIDILGKTEAAAHTRDVLHNVLLLLPQYALGDALVELSKNDITAQLLEQFHMDTYKSPLGWELLGVHYVSLAFIGGILFLINLTIECRAFPDIRAGKVLYEAEQEDDDVAKERVRVEGNLNDDVIKTVKLRKEYKSVYGTNVAVENLSFGVQAGTCFGLLGVNGAGKSTTFRMLTTETIPTAGKISLKGVDIGNGPLCNGEVGYCPQTDALDGFLTPHQCLTIHGEVCGLNNVPRMVEAMLKRFDLLKYAHRRVDSLSGGNKRKLCTAVSVMSPVSVVLMDEPTSGMDPATKELVGKAIRRVVKSQACVVLTSHSVAECENLCNRVGILAKARLKCIGTPQHLKHKFGEGYVAFLRFSQPVTLPDLRKAISRHFKEAKISSRQGNAARLLVPRSQDMPLSESFARVKLLAEELKATDYTLTQSSLDQVLVNFSEEMEDEANNLFVQSQDNGTTVPNTYTSTDAIHMVTF